jgi:hypothetical protein
MPERADMRGRYRSPELLQGVMVVGGDGNDLGAGHCHLGLVRRQLQVLLPCSSLSARTAPVWSGNE